MRLIPRYLSPRGLDDCVNYVYCRLFPDVKLLPFDLPTEAELYASGWHRVSGINSGAEAVAVMDYYEPLDRMRLTLPFPGYRESPVVAVHIAILQPDDPYLVDHKPGRIKTDIIQTGVDIEMALADYIPHENSASDEIEVPSLLFLRRN